jgi:hypothetical protein
MRKRGLRLLLLFLVTLTLLAPCATTEIEKVPAYNSALSAKSTKLPAILSADQLWGEDAQYPYQTHAYELAAKIPAVLYQQPCYCYCDRIGHKSLHSCFETTHGAKCSICLKEAYYSYLMHQKGRTAAQVRKGIIRGEWKQVSLATAASIN